MPENSDWISCSGCENSRSSGEKPNFDPKPQKTRNDSSYQSNKDGTCYPSIGTIAKDLKLSRRTVQRAIADLEKTGHLQKEQRWRENGGKSSLLFTVK